MYSLSRESQHIYDMWEGWKESNFTSFARYLHQHDKLTVKICQSCFKESPYLIEDKDIHICKRCHEGREKTRVHEDIYDI